MVLGGQSLPSFLAVLGILVDRLLLVYLGILLLPWFLEVLGVLVDLVELGSLGFLELALLAFLGDLEFLAVLEDRHLL